MFDRKEYNRQYSQSQKNKKNATFRRWRRRGIIHHDLELLYDMYMEATNCDYCKCILDTSKTTKKCLDHDHDIVDDENVRGVLCFNCNVKDVLNDNKKERKIQKNNKTGFKNIRYDTRDGFSQKLLIKKDFIKDLKLWKKQFNIKKSTLIKPNNDFTSFHN